MGNATQLKIFLSSTAIDLADIRVVISKWLSEIFDAKLIVMESFGSDAAAPDVYSVRRVREADFFIGIYAHRYGTIDPKTGRSITELELDEAKRCFSTGLMRDILLYVIARNAPWPEEYIEKEEIAQAGLKGLKAKAHEHTITYFNSLHELPFYIIRDVYKRIYSYFDLTPPEIRPQILQRKRHLLRPLGLEFVSGLDRDYLIGRGEEVDEIVGILGDDPVVLLLGDSGVGKTSLLHAGLIPRLISRKWRCIYTRPFGFPCTDIVNQILANVFKERTTYRGPLAPIMAEVMTAIEDQKTLLIIDQFEDVLLTSEGKEVDELVSGIITLLEFHNPSLRMIISYRADHEGRLGEYWKKISGSARGLPRVYLRGLSVEGVWEGILKTASDLSIMPRLDGDEVDQLKKDLMDASMQLGAGDVYPPYMQMFVDHMWSISKEKADSSYGYEDYQAAGSAEGIIGGYLTRQLAYTHDIEGNIRTVLIDLVKSHGVRAQRSIDEIAGKTGIDRHQCEIALEKLIGLRLVRHVGENIYEISHDFITRKLIEEYVAPEEREFKRFNELLTSRAATYRTGVHPKFETTS